MTKARLLLLSLGIIVATAVIGIYVIGVYSGVRSGVEVTSDAVAKVYLNGVYEGTTPVTVTNARVGSQLLKLIPTDTDLLPYETTLSLAPQVKTIVRHKFSNQLHLSSTEVLSLKKHLENEATITVVTKPSDTEISLDGTAPTKTPIKVSTNEGIHTLTLKKNGFVTKNIDIVAATGYDLTVYVELSGVSSSPAGATPEIESTNTFIQIKGLAKKSVAVYGSPNLYSQEVGQIPSGQNVQVLDRDEKNKWVKVFSEDYASGWVEARFTTAL